MTSHKLLDLFLGLGSFKVPSDWKAEPDPTAKPHAFANPWDSIAPRFSHSELSPFRTIPGAAFEAAEAELDLSLPLWTPAGRAARCFGRRLIFAPRN